MKFSRHMLCAALVAATVATPVLAQYSTPMRDVENPDRSMFMQNSNASLAPPFVNNFMFFSTPSGKRYFLEQVALTCQTPSASDQIVQAQVSTTMNSGTIIQGISGPQIIMERRGPAPFGGYIWTGSAMVRMYSDADAFTPGGGSGISFNIFHSDTTVTASCYGMVSGHTLVP